MSKTLYVRIPGNTVDENIEYLQYNGYGIVSHVYRSDVYICTMNADLVPIALADAKVVDEETMLRLSQNNEYIKVSTGVLQTLTKWYLYAYGTDKFDMESVTAFYDYICQQVGMAANIKLVGIFNASDMQQKMRLAMMAQAPVS